MSRRTSPPSRSNSRARAGVSRHAEAPTLAQPAQRLDADHAALAVRDDHDPVAALRGDVLEQRDVAGEDAGARDLPARELAEVVVDVEGDVERRPHRRRVARQHAAEQRQRRHQAGGAEHQRRQPHLRQLAERRARLDERAAQRRRDLEPGEHVEHGDADQHPGDADREHQHSRRAGSRRSASGRGAAPRCRTAPGGAPRGRPRSSALAAPAAAGRGPCCGSPRARRARSGTG